MLNFEGQRGDKDENFSPSDPKTCMNLKLGRKSKIKKNVFNFMVGSVRLVSYLWL